MLQFVHNVTRHSVIKVMSNVTVKLLLPNLHLRITTFRPENQMFCATVLLVGITEYCCNGRN